MAADAAFDAGLARSIIDRKTSLAGAALPILHDLQNAFGYVDDEFEPYRGKSLCLRSAACGAAYVSLWGVFALLASPNIGIITGELWRWLYVAPPFVVLGALTGMSAFDFEFGDGIFHYSFYLVATLLLRWAAGMKWIWDVG